MKVFGLDVFQAQVICHFQLAIDGSQRSHHECILFMAERNYREHQQTLRQYIPKCTDISTVTDKRIKMIPAKIDRRLREELNFSIPKQEFYKYYL